MMAAACKGGTWIDISGEPLERKWAAIHEHVTQIAPDFPMVAFGLDGWRELWSREAYILRESRVETALPEDDLFAGITSLRDRSAIE